MSSKQALWGSSAGPLQHTPFSALRNASACGYGAVGAGPSPKDKDGQSRGLSRGGALQFVNLPPVGLRRSSSSSLLPLGAEHAVGEQPVEGRLRTKERWGQEPSLMVPDATLPAGSAEPAGVNEGSPWPASRSRSFYRTMR